MKIFGLTGSIAMGKTYVKSHFQNLGIKVYDADNEVKKLYNDFQIIEKIKEIFPDCVIDKFVDINKLGNKVFESKDLLVKLENIFYPTLRENRKNFINNCLLSNEKLIILDIPLLYEKNREVECDKVIVVTSDEKSQKERALKREGMTKEKLAKILSSQISNEEKLRRADYIIYNDNQHLAIVDQIKEILSQEGIVL